MVLEEVMDEMLVANKRCIQLRRVDARVIRLAGQSDEASSDRNGLMGPLEVLWFSVKKLCLQSTTTTQHSNKHREQGQ